MTVIETLFVLLFLSLGTFFMIVAALGVFRMPDVYNQLHTLTKAATLALLNLLIAAIIANGSLSVVMKSVLIIAFQFMTAPVSAHMISRVQHPHSWEGTVLDEMSGEPTAGLEEEDKSSSTEPLAREG